MKVYAKNYNLVCEPYEVQTQNSSHLLINTSNSNNIAKIIDIDEEYNDHNKYHCGDIVIYDAQYASKCMLCGKEYIIFCEGDVLAIIKEDE